MKNAFLYITSCTEYVVEVRALSLILLLDFNHLVCTALHA